MRPFQGQTGSQAHTPNRPYDEPSERQMSAGTVTVNFGAPKPATPKFSPRAQNPKFGQKGPNQGPNVTGVSYYGKPQNQRHSTGGFHQPRPQGLVPKRTSFAPKSSTMPSRTRPYWENQSETFKDLKLLNGKKLLKVHLFLPFMLHSVIEKENFYRLILY